MFKFENEESTDTTRKRDKKKSVDLPHIPALGGDEEAVKERD